MTTAVPGSAPGAPGATGPVAALAASVVICAYTDDRWVALLAAIESVRSQLQPGDEVIVVIDHNPGLRERTVGATAAWANVGVLANANGRGLSGARNTGVAASRGDVVAFLDDDATARPGWLTELRAGFLDDAVAVVGTTVNPRWEGGTPPRWFPPEFHWVVGCGYTGLPTETAVIRNPIGASMAVRATAFTVAGDFSDLVGRVGTLPVGCEETEFCIRLTRVAPGAVILYRPGSAVDHLVPASRQTLRYFVRRCFHEGRSKWAVARLGGSKAGLSAERRYVRVVLPAGVAAGLGQAVRRLDPAGLARASAIVLGLACTLAGFASEAVRQLATHRQNQP